MKKFSVLALLALMMVFGLAHNAFAQASERDFTYTTISGGIRITGYTGSNTNLVIPSTIEGRPVLIIGREGGHSSNRFTSTNLVTLVIPAGVTALTSNVFQNQRNLRTVTLPDSIETIGANAFNGCSNLTTINIPANIKTIDVRAFYGCTELYNLTIPASISSISFTTNLDRYTFEGCEKLPIATRERLRSLGYSAASRIVRERLQPVTNATNATTSLSSDARSKAIALVLGQDLSVTLGASEKRVYKFTIERNASSFVVLTRGSLDTLLTLFNESGSRITSDDDSGDNYNARISSNLNSGMYYIELSTYGGSAGQCTLVTTVQ